MTSSLKILLLLLLACGTLQACNTWSGFGQDMQKLGKKIEKQGDKDKSSS